MLSRRAPATIKFVSAPFGTQRHATARALIDAAEQLLAEGVPFPNIRVQHLIARAGLARSTFYLHFADMGAVLDDIARDMAADIGTAVRRWTDLTGAVSRDDLRSAFVDLADLYHQKAFVLAAISDAAVTDGNQRAKYLATLGIGKRLLADHLSTARIGGHTHSGIDPEPTAAWIVWMVERGLYQEARYASKKQRGRLVESLVDIVWRALYVDSVSM